MEKKFNFSTNPTAQKSIYAIVIALLCITAIIVGVLAANSRKTDTPPAVENPPITDGNGTGEGNGGGTGDGNGNGSGTGDKATFIAPISGTVVKSHSTTVPVYSETLEEWRIHTGIDISCDEGASVFAACDGTVSAVRSDPLLGKTIEITHEGGIKTVYSNLAADGLVAVGKEVRAGEKIATVGDTSISELADEAHLHFAMYVNGVSVDPLDYIAPLSKESSLGIKEESAA